MAGVEWQNDCPWCGAQEVDWQVGAHEGGAHRWITMARCHQGQSWRFLVCRAGKEQRQGWVNARDGRWTTEFQFVRREDGKGYHLQPTP